VVVIVGYNRYIKMRYKKVYIYNKYNDGEQAEGEERCGGEPAAQARGGDVGTSGV
jgi:hypothetical protein